MAGSELIDKEFAFYLLLVTITLMNKRLVAGNWKMNPATVIEAKNLARKFRLAAASLERTEAVICPPFPYISVCKSREIPKNFFLGAQSASTEVDTGPHTGEVSATMLKDMGVEYVVVGHSEQRQKGDTDANVSKRLRNVLEQGMQAIVCVGENTRDPEGSYLESLKNQIRNSLEGVAKKFTKDIVIAYEPVWAIGGKDAMRPEDVYETSLFVKKIFADVFTPDAGIKTRVLYGGSVNSHNAPDIITIGKADGFLVGRESVNSVGFVELLRAVDTLDI